MDAAYAPIDHNLDFHPDVYVINPVDGEVLTYEEATQRWINQAVAGMIQHGNEWHDPDMALKSDYDSHIADPNAHHDRLHALDSALDHSNVEISAPADGQFLAYDEAAAKWKNVDPVISDIIKVCTPASVAATASGNTAVWTPASGKKLRIKLIMVFNSGTAAITVYLRFTTTGTARFKAYLAANSGYTINLIGTNWEGAANEALYINLSASGSVDVTVMGEEI